MNEFYPVSIGSGSAPSAGPRLQLHPYSDPRVLDLVERIRGYFASANCLVHVLPLSAFNQGTSSRDSAPVYTKTRRKVWNSAPASSHFGRYFVGVTTGGRLVASVGSDFPFNTEAEVTDYTVGGLVKELTPGLFFEMSSAYPLGDDQVARPRLMDYVVITEDALDAPPSFFTGYMIVVQAPVQ